MRASLVFLSVIPAMAQFSGLASTDDGSQLYFSSPLQLAGTTDENNYSKIFRYDSMGIHFVAQVARVATAGGYLLATSNPYNLTSAYVSGNGSVYGYVGTADCSGGCYYQGLQQTTLQFAGSFTPYVLPYGCQVSKNARYALCLTGGRAASEYFAVFDLFGTGKPIYYPACGQITSVGDAYCGTELFSLSGSVTTLSLPASVVSEIPISDDASTIAYVLDMLSDGGPSPGYSLYVEDVSSGAQSLVYTDKQSRMLYPVGLSNNGGVVLFELYSAGAIAQAAVVHADGTGFLQLTNDPAGVTSAILSGDGSTAFVVANSGKLMKFDTASGASTLIAAGAVLQSVTGAAVAGAPNTITGAGLADTAITASVVPLGTSLGGVQVTINGIPAPLFSVSPTSILFQIPWEISEGNASVAVVRPSSPFLPPGASLQVVNSQPAAAVPYAFSQNFIELTGTPSAANPGDIVSFYLSGLGPVTVPVADGAASPSVPLSLLTTPVTVSVSSSQLGSFDYTGPRQLNVLYAGLAPGLIGIYQLTVQLPPQIPHDGLFPNSVPFFLTLNSSFNLPPVWVIPNQ